MMSRTGSRRSGEADLDDEVDVEEHEEGPTNPSDEPPIDPPEPVEQSDGSRFPRQGLEMPRRTVYR
jgi:hypothetical protein